MSGEGRGSDGVTDDFRRRMLALHTALVCDSMLHMGLPYQVMNYQIRAIYPGARLVGRAATALATSVYRPPTEAWGPLFDYIRAFQLNDVAVVTTTGDVRGGVWGGLVSTGGKARGAVGMVTDGVVRDAEEIEQLPFPVFARGHSPIDSLGVCEIVDRNISIECGGARVNPGDIVFGDYMGVVVIPAEAADEVLRRSEEKNVGENHARRDLAAGVDIGEVFERHGVL